MVFHRRPRHKALQSWLIQDKGGLETTSTPRSHRAGSPSGCEGGRERRVLPLWLEPMEERNASGYKTGFRWLKPRVDSSTHAAEAAHEPIALGDGRFHQTSRSRWQSFWLPQRSRSRNDRCLCLCLSVSGPHVPVRHHRRLAAQWPKEAVHIGKPHTVPRRLPDLRHLPAACATAAIRGGLSVERTQAELVHPDLVTTRSLPKGNRFTGKRVHL